LPIFLVDGRVFPLILWDLERGYPQITQITQIIFFVSKLMPAYKYGFYRFLKLIPVAHDLSLIVAHKPEATRHRNTQHHLISIALAL
jgi:hypothetical protein